MIFAYFFEIVRQITVEYLSSFNHLFSLNVIDLSIILNIYIQNKCESYYNATVNNITYFN